ncbi:MAG: NAD(P)H-dependent oxidoreductase, partial [Candidatus Sulfotelmatobacter sp.]
MKLLRVDSSARHNSVSRQLTSRFAEAWRKENPQGTVIERDLASTTLPQITDEWVHAIHTDPASLTAEQRQVLAISDQLVDEV